MESSTKNEEERSVDSCRSLPDSSAQEWQRRIYSLQSQRYTPEMRKQCEEQVKAKAARKKRIENSCKSARRLETTNYLSSVSNMCTLRSFSGPMGTSSDQTELYKSSAPKTLDRAKRLQQCAVRRTHGLNNEADKSDDNDDEDLDELTSELMQDIQTNNSTTSPALMSSLGQFRDMNAGERANATSSMNTELLNLLKQLEVEPTEESELAAKFVLFETFLETVTVVREQTLNFWNENKDLFEGGMRSSAERELKKIDNEESMGIEDDPRKWFVYTMTKKANQNNGKIANTLSLLRSRLEQINKDDLGECPFCLEDLATLKKENQTTVLSCCHRVCTPCWIQWHEIKRSNAFCPLCRTDEFVEEVLTNSVV